MRVAGLFLFTCFAAFASEAAAYCRSTTIKPVAPEVCSHVGAPLEWYDRCADVKLFPRAKPGLTTDQVADVVQASFDTWNEVTCDGDLVGLNADVAVAETLSNEPLENAVLFIDDPNEWVERVEDDGALAVTAVVFGTRSGRIYAADIEINDWAFNLGICGASCPPGVTDLQNMLTHEVGHFYGMGHMPEGDPATMEERALPGETHKRTLHADDVAGICAVYPPGTFPEACTGSTFYADDEGGCGCTAIGSHRVAAHTWLGLVAALALFALRARKRRRAL